MDQNNELVVKLLVLGDAGVGKTSLLVRFWDDRYSQIYRTPADFRCHTVKIDDKIIKLHMWDTCGRERFRPMTALHYRGTHGIMFVFDLTDSKTFNNIDSWLAESENFTDPNIVKLLVGSKHDLANEREVPYKKAQEYANMKNMLYIETSAKEGINVEKAFMTLTKEVKRNFDAGLFNISGPVLYLAYERMDAGWLRPCAC